MDPVSQILSIPMLKLVRGVGQTGLLVLRPLTYVVQDIWGESRLLVLATSLTLMILLLGFVIHTSLYLVLKVFGISLFVTDLLYGILSYALQMIYYIMLLLFRIIALMAPSLARPMMGTATSMMTRTSKAFQHALFLLCYPGIFVTRTIRRAFRYWFVRLLCVPYDLSILVRLLFKARSIKPPDFTYSPYGTVLASWSLEPPSKSDTDRHYHYMDYMGKPMDEADVLDVASTRGEPLVHQQPGTSSIANSKKAQVYHIFATKRERDVFLKELHAARMMFAQSQQARPFGLGPARHLDPPLIRRPRASNRPPASKVVPKRASVLQPKRKPSIPRGHRRLEAALKSPSLPASRRKSVTSTKRRR